MDSYRAEISKACAEFVGGTSGVFRLVVPCGAGKTLSALRYALQKAEHYSKKHVFILRPSTPSWSRMQVKLQRILEMSMLY